MDDDIRRLAESAKGQRFKAVNEARWNRAARAASRRCAAKWQAEEQRHAKRIKAIAAERDAAMRAAKEAHINAEREFFRKNLEAASPPQPDAADQLEAASMKEPA